MSKVAKKPCPVTGKPIPYSGRGRPPVFHPSVTLAQRKAYRDAGK